MRIHLSIEGRGEARNAKRSEVNAAAESALAAIRYADPASWTTAAAMARAIASRREEVLTAHDRVAVIVTSAEGPVEAMAAMHEASRGGSSSPIRFPASNAGSLAGIGSIAFGFRGPTLVLTLPADRGAPVGRLLAEAWLGRGVAAWVVLASCARVDDEPRARCLLLGARAGGETPIDHDFAWLCEAAR